MGLYITSLNSGSNGNCYYIGNEEDAVLIDAGISCKETEKRMRRLGLSMEKVRAIFISHEHNDHINGLEVLTKKYSLPVYITPVTLANSRLRLDSTLCRFFSPETPVSVGTLSILAFGKYHDAGDPHSFIISYDNCNVGVFTDIGRVCRQLTKYFRLCHAAFLESNYDDVMLEEGTYPVHLKNRIRGGHGHLSNAESLQLVRTSKPPFMTHLFLSHLSRNNNDPELVMRLFAGACGNTKVKIASRFSETELFHIFSSEMVIPPQTAPARRSNRSSGSEILQLSLFS